MYLVGKRDLKIYLINDGDEVNFIDIDGIKIIDSYTYSSSSDDGSWGKKVDGGSILKRQFPSKTIFCFRTSFSWP